jgi:hypothetical protein
VLVPAALSGSAESLAPDDAVGRSDPVAVIASAACDRPVDVTCAALGSTRTSGPVDSGSAWLMQLCCRIVTVSLDETGHQLRGNVKVREGA